MSSFTGLFSSGGGGGAPVNSIAKLNLGGQTLYTDEIGGVWLRSGNILTSGLENYPNAKVKKKILLSSTSYDNVSFNLGGENRWQFKPDGTVIYRRLGNELRQHNLSTAWDITTISSSPSATIFINSYDNQPRWFQISPDGKGLYVGGATNQSIGYSPLNTAWDISTINTSKLTYYGVKMQYGFNGNSNSITNNADLLGAYADYAIFSDDGSRLYLMGYSGNVMQIRIPNNNWADAVGQFYIEKYSSVGRFSTSFAIKGENIISINASNGIELNHSFISDGDISTINYTGELFNPAEIGGTLYFEIKPDLSKIYISDTSTLRQYSLTTEDYIGIPAPTHPNEYLKIK